jgi:hypothetical protein
MHERAWLKDIYSVSVRYKNIIEASFNSNNIQVKAVVETSDWEHSKQLKALLADKYTSVVFNDVPMAIGPY